MSKNKDSNNIHIITTETDAEYEMLQGILREGDKRLPLLEAMTREERIEYFHSRFYPQNLNFGSTIIHVNTHFDKKSQENVIDRVRRVSDKIN